jgi:uncharacterized membrane protein
VLTTGDPEQLCSAEDARLRASSLGWSDELVGRAAAAAVATPAPAHWRRLLVLAAGALGTGLFASGVVTFVAYNWAALGRFARLGLVQLLLIAATVLAARLRGRLAGQIALSLGAVLVGALLAVYGQTYQTGADPFELFLLWAALMVPWALAARFAPLFLLQSVVLGTGVVLAWQELAALGHQRFIGAALSLWALGTLAVAAWEMAASRAPPAHRWLPRVWAAMAGVPLALGTAYAILQSSARDELALALGAVATSLGLVVWRYHRRSVDLFMQTVACAVLMAVVSTALGNALFKSTGDALGPLLVLALAVIGQAGGAVAWLRHEARRARAD